MFNKTFSGFISNFSGFSKKVPAYLSETNYFRPRIKQKSMNRNVKLISILSLGLMLGACSGNSSSQEETIIVKTATANTYSNETVKEFPIITQPFRTTELSFRVSGPIDRLDVYAGNYYRRGDIIAEIDPRDYRIRRERAEAVYRQAKAEYERISALYQKNNLSASTYEKARAEYTSAKAAFDTAINELEDTRLVAPFNGYVSEVYVEKFQDVKASQPVLTFIDIDQLKIEAYVTQDIAYRVQPRQNVLLTLDVQPDAELEAQIAEVSKGTTQNNLSYLVTALLPNKEARLLAGMSGKIRFEESTSELSDSTATGEHLVCIPQTALCNRPTVGSYVWTVHPESGIVSQRKVSVSKLLPHGNAGITAGLQPGEIVATSSLRFLSEGMKVKIQ